MNGLATGCDVLIAAAGESTRMGRCKALLEFGESTFIQTLVTGYKKAGFEHIWVTVPEGDDGERVSQHLTDTAICLPNQYPARGLHGSVLTFLAHSHSNSNFLMTPIDSPFVFPTLVKELRCRLAEKQPAHLPSVALPTFKGQRGHPAVFSSGCRTLFQRFDTPRDVIDHIGNHILEIETTHHEVLLNINDPASYKKLLGSSQDVFN